MKNRDESSAASERFRDERWIRRIRTGNHKAFEKLFFAYAGDLCAFAAQHLDEEEMAEDIVQEVFCDLWRRHESLSPKGTTKAYLFRAVRNKALDCLDHRRVSRNHRAAIKRDQHLERRGAGNEPLRNLQSQELRQRVKQAVENLPERRRMIYCMVRRHGMSYVEVSDSLDIATKTVENQMGRALKTLRDRLKEYHTDGVT